MGRFYNTEKTTFLNPNDVIYNPDFDMAMKLLDKKDKEYKEQEAVADSLYNIDFNYLNSDEDTENARQIKDYFQTKADDIIAKMQADPTNYFKYNNELKSLQREYTLSKTKGDIASLEGSYNAYHNWDKVNKEICEKQPALCNALKNEAWSNWGGNSIVRQWKQERALKEIDQSKFADEISKMVADLNEQIDLSNQGYIYVKTKWGQEKLTKERVRDYVLGKVLNNPEYVSYMKQSDRVKLSNYFNPDGSAGDTLNRIVSTYLPYAYEKNKIDKDIHDNKARLMELEYSLKDKNERAKEDREEKRKLGQMYYDSSYGNIYTPEEANKAILESYLGLAEMVTPENNSGADVTQLMVLKDPKTGKTDLNPDASEETKKRFYNGVLEVISTNLNTDMSTADTNTWMRVAAQMLAEANYGNMINRPVNTKNLDVHGRLKTSQISLEDARNIVDSNLQKKYSNFNKMSEEEKDKLRKEESIEMFKRQAPFAMLRHKSYLDNTGKDLSKGKLEYGAWDSSGGVYNGGMLSGSMFQERMKSKMTQPGIVGTNFGSLNKEGQEFINKAAVQLANTPGALTVSISNNDLIRRGKDGTFKRGIDLTGEDIAALEKAGVKFLINSNSDDNTAVFEAQVSAKQLAELGFPSEKGDSSIRTLRIVKQGVGGGDMRMFRQAMVMGGGGAFAELQGNPYVNLKTYHQLNARMADTNYRENKKVYLNDDFDVIPSVVGGYAELEIIPKTPLAKEALSVSGAKSYKISAANIDNISNSNLNDKGLIDVTMSLANRLDAYYKDLERLKNKKEDKKK